MKIMHLSEHLKQSKQPINESILLSLGLLALCLKPVMDSSFGKSVGDGVGSLFGGIGEYFKKRGEARRKKIEDKIERSREKAEKKRLQKELDDHKKSSEIDLIYGSARKHLKKDDQELLDKVSGSLRDKDGNMDPEGFAKRLKGATGKTPAELSRETRIDKISQEDLENAEENFKDTVNKLSDEELDKLSQENQERSEKIAKEIEPASDAEMEKAEKEEEMRKKEAEKKDSEDKETTTYQDKEEDKSDPEGQKDPETGEIVKDEEITTKKGKKIRVQTHTGPKGGKYYWPKGSPHDAKHKVYVENYLSLRDWLNQDNNF